jgi:hypothetical protein
VIASSLTREVQVIAPLLVVLAVLPVPAFAVTVTRGDWSLSLDGSETANLAYQLDCMSDSGSRCSRDAFRALWKDQLGWTGADEVALQRWHELHARYARSFRLDEPRGSRPYMSMTSVLDVSGKLRTVFLQAPTRAALDHDLRLLVTPSDADALLGVLDGFAPRFHPWFARSAERHLAEFAARFARLLRERGLMDHVVGAAHLYGVPAGRHAVHVHLIAHPLAKAHTNGEQLEDHAVVECLAGEAPEERIDVVLHEVFHFMYFEASATRDVLEQAFLASPDARALAAYNLLNEVLATVLGNALVPKHLLSAAAYAHLLDQPRALYDDPFIAPVARQVVPLVEQRLQARQPLDAAFAADFVAAARQALGARIDSPIPALRTLAIAWDSDSLQPAAEALIGAVRPSSTMSSSPLSDAASVASFADHARVSGVVLVLAAQVPHLASWRDVLGKEALATLTQRAQHEPTFVQQLARPGGASIWLFVARDVPAMQELVARFANN